MLFYAVIIYLAAKFSPADEEKTATPRRSSISMENTAAIGGQDTLAAQRAPMLMKYTATLNR
jgi:hypothetical protein